MKTVHKVLMITAMILGFAIGGVGANTVHADTPDCCPAPICPPAC